MPIKDRVKAAYQTMRDFVVPNPAHTANGQTWLMPAKRAEFKNVEPFDNGAVMACLDWTTRNFEQAPFSIYRTQRDGKRKPVTEHPLFALLDKPNDYYGGFQLMAATLISYDLNGNAYWLKRRGAGGVGLPEELWYVPHWMMRPHTEPNSQNFIDYYVYTVNGRQWQVPIEDVVHFRNGLNPNDVREGFSNLRAVLREIFADDESSVFAASILKNMGIPGLIVTPEQGVYISPESGEDIKQKVVNRTTGNERGKPIVLDFAAKMTELGMSPVDLNTVEQRMFFEQRICAVLGIAPSVVNLPSGSKNAQSYNNLVNLRKSAFEENLCPRWRSTAREIKRQLLRDFPNSAGLSCEYDTREVAALKEAESDRQKREREKFQGCGCTWNEYRESLGMPPHPDGDWLLLPSNAQPITLERIRERAEMEVPDPMAMADAASNEPDADNDPAKGLKKKSYEWEGRNLSRQPTELEEKQLEAVAAAQDASRAAFVSALTPIRARLIESGLPQLQRGLLIELTEGEKVTLRREIEAAYFAGRNTVRGEGKALEKALSEVLVRVLAALGISFVARISGRLLDEYARAILRGATPEQAVDWVRAEMESEPAAYVEEIASGVAYEAVGEGRKDELIISARPGDRFIYSAILDANTCGPCRRDDLKESENLNDLPQAPNPFCKGRYRCRCMIVIARD